MNNEYGNKYLLNCLPNDFFVGLFCAEQIGKTLVFLSHSLTVI